MVYKNGKDVLPAELLKELQKYIQGELIYIPCDNNSRKAWGECNGTRSAMKERNYKIYSLYKEGLSIEALINLFNLSEDSIRKIIVKVNQEKNMVLQRINSI